MSHLPERGGRNKKLTLYTTLQLHMSIQSRKRHKREETQLLSFP
jgi:hypothetical protein